MFYFPVYVLYHIRTYGIHFEMCLIRGSIAVYHEELGPVTKNHG